jgi:hypothetical protein
MAAVLGKRKTLSVSDAVLDGRTPHFRHVRLGGIEFC